MKKSRPALRALLAFLAMMTTIYLWWITPSGYPVLQGATDASSTQFATVISKDEQVECLVKDLDSAQDITTEKQATRTRADSHWAVHKCSFNGLDYKKHYEFVVKEKTGKVLVRRKFGLLDPEKSQARIAVYSCANDWYHLPFMWGHMESAKPDLIFAIGDNVYADVNPETEVMDISPKLLYRRYASTWRVLRLFKFDPLIPIIGLWDDHDFGENNSNSKFALKNESKEIFNTFFAQEEENEIFRKGPGVSSELKAFGTQFIFLDGRTYRSDVRSAESSYFSEEQLNWMKELLLKEESPTWLISGTQFFSHPPVEESFEFEHPEGFAQFQKIVASTGRQIFLVSGDTHFAELKKITSEYFQSPVYEITSSAIHALPIGIPGNDSRRIWSYMPPNFVTLDFKKERPQEIHVEVHNFLGQSVFTENISLERTRHSL